MYIVPHMKLIPQSKTNSCWYASAQMLVQWRNRAGQECLVPSPSQIPGIHTWEVHNQRITNPQVILLAKGLGLKTISPESLTLAGIEAMLRKHGPLWTNGVSHIVVIGGANPGNGRVLVYDPWPVGQGSKHWRSYVQWYIRGKKVDSRDTSATVNAVFLYAPQ
jgi:hypothetical protein